MTISQERMEQELHFLAQTDEKFGAAKTDMERAEILRKRIRARVFLTSTGTVAERNCKAEDSEEAMAADREYDKALLVYETLRAQRQTAEIVIDTWRSIEASRRRA